MNTRFRCLGTSVKLEKGLLFCAWALSVQLLFSIIIVALIASDKAEMFGPKTTGILKETLNGFGANNRLKINILFLLFLFSIPLLAQATVTLHFAYHKLEHHFVVPGFVALVFNFGILVTILVLQCFTLVKFLDTEKIMQTEIGSVKPPQKPPVQFIVPIVATLLLLAFTLWLIYVIIRCYRLLKSVNPFANGIIEVNLAVLTDPSYRCCCRSIHVRSASLIISVLFLFTLILPIWDLAFRFILPFVAKSEFVQTCAQVPMNLLGESAAAAETLLLPLAIPLLIQAILGLWIGYSTQHHYCVVPALTLIVYNMLHQLIIMGLQIARIASAVKGPVNSWDREKATIISGSLIALVTGMSFAVSIWFFFVLLRCYHYYKRNSILIPNKH